MNASTNRAVIRYVVETILGQTPAAPVWNDFASSAFALDMKKDTGEANTIRADRNNAGTLQLGVSVAGDLTSDLVDEHSVFLSAALQNPFVAGAVGGAATGSVSAGLISLVLAAGVSTLVCANAADYNILKGSRLIKVSASTAGNSGTSVVIARNDGTTTLTLAPGSVIANETTVTNTALLFNTNTATNGVNPVSFTLG